MFIVRYRKIFFIITVLITALSLWSIVHYGFNFGIDFKGGSILEVAYPEAKPETDEVRKMVAEAGIGSAVVQPVGERNYAVRTKELTSDEHTVLSKALSRGGTIAIEEVRFNSIGPVVGEELRNKAYLAIVVVILAIVLFVTFAFRKVSEPVASWKYGLATILALAHDVIVPTGVFVAFSHFYGGEIDLLFVSAILAILGYSVHDTIVVFDRVRENLRINKEDHHAEGFDETVGKSLSQTFGRSINTSLTIFLVLMALYFLGGEATRNFAFVLLVGVIAGTYSSIFLASPLLVTLEKLQLRRKK